MTLQPLQVIDDMLKSTLHSSQLSVQSACNCDVHAKSQLLACMRIQQIILTAIAMADLQTLHS